MNDDIKLPEPAGAAYRYATSGGHSDWGFHPEAPAWRWPRSDKADRRGVVSWENVYAEGEVRRLIAEAVAAEREACARVCDEQHDRARTSTGASRAATCADRIRARTGSTT